MLIWVKEDHLRMSINNKADSWSHCKNYYKTEKYFNIAVSSSSSADDLQRFL